MGTALLVSLHFHPGHVSHVSAGYRQFEELGYESVYCVTEAFVPYLPAGSRICVYGKDRMPKTEVAVFVFPSQKNLMLIRSLKRRGTKILYVFHEPLAQLKEYRKAGFSYKYLVRLWVIDRISALTVKWSHAILLPSVRALEYYRANPLYKNKNFFYFPLQYDDERTPGLVGMPRTYFSYIGTVAPDHSFNEYLRFVEEAVEKGWLPGLKFLIATKSEFEVPSRLQDSARVVIRKGRPLDNDEINVCYASSYAVWNAYARTTQSGVLAKSFMFGTPAVVLRKNLSEFAGDGREVVAIEDNASFDEIAGAVEEILKHFNQYGGYARQRFLDTFYYRKHNETMSGIIDKIKMQKLWILTELFPPDETSTAYILGEIANACTREYEVHVICGPEVYDPRKKLDVEHPFMLGPDLVVHRAKGFGADKNRAIGKALSFLLMSVRLYRLFRKSMETGDKVLLVTNPAPLVLLVSKWRKKRAFLLNLLVHDVFPENTVPAGLRLPDCAYRFVKKKMDRAYSRVDRFITLGRDMAEVVRKKAGSAADVRIVENWADIDLITPQAFPAGPIKLEYAGNIGRVQGLERVVNELPDGVELHFYGTGSLERKLKSLRRPGVFFHGPYFRSAQNKILGDCHAALVTLADDMYGLGVPSKMYNIMAAGRPVLYFGPEEGEIALLIKENGIGYIGWPSAWDLDELMRMGRKARMLAESHYSRQAILAKFMEALR